MSISPYAQVGPNLVANGYSAIPIMPGSKRPGLADRGIGEWQRFCDRLPKDLEVGLWSSRPDLGVGVALGAASGGLVAIDIDSEDTAIWAAVEALTGVSPVRKRGRKGYTGFFRASDAVTPRAFKFTNGGVDLLAHGRQTVLPPSLHKDTGLPYVWLSVDTLAHVRPEHLPELPDDIADRLADALAPFGYVAQPERIAAHVAGDSSDDRWRDTNEAALANLADWVPALGIGAKRNGASWRAQAKWRNGDGYNVSFHPKGIRDFATDDAYSPIDIVAKVADVEPREAMNMLRDKLGLRDPEPVAFLLGADEVATLGDTDCDVDVTYKDAIAKATEVAMIAFPDIWTEHGARIVQFAKDRLYSMHVFGIAYNPFVNFLDGADEFVSRVVEKLEAPADRFAQFYGAAERRPDLESGLWGILDDPALCEALLKRADEALRALAVVASPLDPFDPSAAGGLLQQTAEWIYETSFVPSRELSMLTAIGIMAAFLSRRYVGPTGLSPNLYLVGLASTATGKDAPLKAAKNLFVDPLGGMHHMLGAGDIASDAAIERLIRHKPACLLPMDEVGAWLQEGSGRNAPQYAKNRTKSLLELFTNANENGVWLGKDKAGSEGLSSSEPIYMPCMSILGMSTEATFFNGLVEGNTADGLLNRMTFMHIPPVKAGRPRVGIDTSVPQGVRAAYMAALEAWPASKLSKAAVNIATSKPWVVKVPFADDDAREEAWLVWDEQEAMVEADRELGGVAKRAFEQTLKLALIRAVSRDFVTPAVTVDDVKFGAAVAWTSTKHLRAGLRAYMAGSEFEGNCKAMLRAVEAAGPEGIAEYRLRTRAGVSKLRPRDFDEVVKHLTATGRWRVEKPSNRGARYHPLKASQSTL